MANKFKKKMQQSRIIKYIEALPARERERFRLFVQSPYYNQHQPTIELLDIVLEALDGDKEQLERRKVYRRLYPKRRYHEQTIHNLLSSLMKLYQKFLAAENLEKGTFTQELATLQEAHDINQFDLFTNRAHQLKKKLKKHHHRDEDFHQASYQVNLLEGYYIASYMDRSDSKQLQKMLDHLDIYYIISKLRNCCQLTANMMLMNTQYDFHFLEPLLNYIKKGWDKYGAEPSIELYYTILLSLREEDNPEPYTRLKDIMANKLDQLSPDERIDLYQFSNNFCIRQINSGRQQYQRELFDLYKQGLRNRLLLNNNLLSEWAYKNIVTLGCKLKEFSWTENFIQEWKEKLPGHRQENAYKYNLANLYYNKQMYEETLSTLHQVQFTDVKYHLNYNFLLLRTYYAMHDTEALLSLIETFRIYVIRNRKMTTEQKRGYTNFLRFAKKLVLLKHQSATFSRKALREKLQHLARKVEDTEHVINSYWILEECRMETETAGVGR